METIYNVNEIIYLPFKTTKIVADTSGVWYYLHDYIKGVLIAKYKEKELINNAQWGSHFADCIKWIDCKDREPNKSGDYLVTVQDRYGNMGETFRTVEVCSYYTTDGDGENEYKGWQTESEVIAWSNLNLEVYVGDYK